MAEWNLTEHFDRIYREASRLCVMCISEHYARKPWTRYERRSAPARALIEGVESNRSRHSRLYMTQPYYATPQSFFGWSRGSRQGWRGGPES
jgi:hypothetical protein